MTPTTLTPELLATPFITSWFAQARPGDIHDPDPARRAAAWAHWALTALGEHTGHSNRTYLALKLPGKFYNPAKLDGREPTPHLEISHKLLNTPDPQFPHRLAQAGNALHFATWLIPEVVAIKRTVINPNAPDIAPLLDFLNARQGALIDALAPLERIAASKWETVEELHVSEPELLAATATAPFTTAEIAEYLPAAQDLNLHVSFDTALAEKSARHAGRRVGVWALTGTSPTPFTLGVVTPRLTRSSMFLDPLFQGPSEAPAALLVRALLLRRIITNLLGQNPDTTVAEPRPIKPARGLRAIVTRIGAQEPPEASTASALHFLHTYPDHDAAWEALQRWANTPVGTKEKPQTRAVLAISKDAHQHAHRAALRAIRRAEDPTREDINVLLPLAWDHQRRVVRVTYSRPPTD